MLNSMIENHLKANPGDEKSTQTKDVQDEKDCFDNRAVSLANAKKMKKAHDLKIAQDKKDGKCNNWLFLSLTYFR